MTKLTSDPKQRRIANAIVDLVVRTNGAITLRKDRKRNIRLPTRKER